MTQATDRFHLLAERSPDALFIETHGRFTYVNPAAARLFGARTPADLIGAELLERSHPQQRARAAEWIAGLHAHPTDVPALAHTFLRLDGTPFDVEISAAPLSSEGEASALVFMRDHAEQQRVDRAWQRERAFLRQVIDACPNLIFVKDREGRFLLANAAVARAYGTVVRQVEGRTDADFNPNADEVANFRRADSEVIDGRSGKLIPEEPVSFADGTVHWYNTSKTPLIDDDGGCRMVLGVATDISDLKRIQEEAQRAQLLLRSIADHTTAVIFAKDPDGRYLLVNRRYCELFHVSNAQMHGRTDADLFPPEVVEALRRADRQVLAAGGPLEFEEQVPQDDGVHSYLALKFPLHDDAGRLFAVCGIATDITERKRAQEALLALNAEYRTLFDLAPIACVVWEAGYRIVEWNAMAERTFGWRREEVLGRNFLEFMVPSAVVARVRAAADAALGEGFASETINQNLTRSGGLVTCEWYNAVLPHAEGRAARVMSMCTDLTARLRAERLEKSEREFRTLAENVPDNILRCDLAGRVQYVNPSLERSLGAAAAELLGTSMAERGDGRLRALHEAVCRVGASGRSEDFELQLPGTGGEPRYHAIRIVPERDAGGRVVSVLAVGRDLTERRTLEEELRLAASVFHSSAEGVLVTDADGKILSVNPAFSDITGYGEQEALGRKPSLLRSDRHDADFYRAMWETLNRDGRWQGEIWNRRKSGEAYLEWLTINRIDDSLGRPVRYVSVFHDITELRRKDERIRHIAFHDALTGLPNRALLQDRLQHAIERARREKTQLAVIFADLDRFKAINDSLGHDVGDLLLQKVALRIRGRLRAADTAARMGGDEFVILMEDLREAGHCAALAAELIAEIARPMELRGHQVQVGASMGMAFYPEDGSDAVDLMRRADMAMYAAKSAGRNTYCFFQPEMLERTSERLKLEMELRQAIAGGELTLHYQPKVELATGRAVGLEALVRWQHPQRGLLSPLYFIPLAEESGLIVALGEWVLEAACLQLAEWQERGRRIPVAVNVSPRQLEQGDLAERIAGLTARHGIAPALLEVELTESAVMADPPRAAGLLTRLREVGVTVAVDDFGTGYSSLAYLRRLPIDVLKIDRSFVMDADHDDEDAQIVKTILALGHTLKLTVVAEGIETAGQAELLRTIGCAVAQGYYFSRPLPREEIEAWLDGGPG